MRPTSIRLAGFTCFKQETALDLRTLGVFAIAGPTGSGKTSLLDAIVFALYGKVPRVGKACGDLVSLGKASLSVALEFEVAGRPYTVTRRLRRNRPATAQLDAGGTTLATGVRQVDDGVERLLGIPYETFVQAVLLPQGEFAQFLRSTGADRTKMLRQLLRVELYEAMRKAAQVEQDRLGERIAGLERQLEGDLRGVTPEAQAALERELAATRAESVRRATELERQRGIVDELRRLRADTETLEQALADAAALERRAKDVAAMQREVDAAERALRVEPALAGARTARSDLRVAEQARDDARRAAAAAEDEHARAAQKQRRAAQDAAAIPALRERLRALDEIRGVLDALASERRRHTEALARQTAAAAEEEKARDAIAKHEADEAAAREAMRRAEEQAAAAGYDAEAAERLDAVAGDAARLAGLRGEAQSAQKDAERDRKAAAKKATAAARAASALDAAREALEDARREVERARLGVEATQRDRLVAELHGALETGAPCPLCTQVVKKVPPRPALPDWEAAERALDEAIAGEKRAAGELDAKTAESAAARADQAAAEQRAAEAKARAERLAEELAAAERSLIEATGSLVAEDGEQAGGGEPIEVRVEAARERFRRARRAHDAAQKDLREALRRGDQARSARDAAAARVAASRASREQHEAHAREHEAQIAAYEERVRRVTQAADPAAERDEVARRIAELENAHRLANEALQHAATELARCRSGHDAALERAADAEAKLAEAEEAAAHAALAAGFADAAAAEAAVRVPAHLERLRAEIAAHARRADAVAARIAELRARLGERTVLAADLADAERRVEALQGDLDESRRAEGALEQQLRSFAELLERAAALRADVEREKLARARYVQLAKDLGSNAFQQFLLRETLHELVERAAVRLDRLSSGRYTLVMADDDFYVVDHDNAGERRPATTLSGGETFLASLALALELSEQVQRAAGAVRLDSLFIDEGFGTLDAESLDVAAEAIESLHAGGRMVGVVTHLDSLTARLPARILVEKLPAEGARLRVES